MKREGQGIVGAGMAYAGDVSPTECWTMLVSHPETMLIDVRTDAEWTFVGRPDLSEINKKVLMVQWQSYPGMNLNASFTGEVEALVPDRSRTMIFICRSGARSRAAAMAMTDAGWRHCFNMAGGFEGDLDAAGHRGRLGGWKVAGLPWIQN